MTRAQMRTGYAAARQRTCLPAEELVSGIVGVLDGLVDAAAVGNRVTIAFAERVKAFETGFVRRSV